MADTHETIADIIAWLRRTREGENAYLTLWRDEIADRLEAAHKRERGDCAKLRKAVERVLCWLKRMNAQPLNTLSISDLTPSHAVNRAAKSIIEDNDYHISQLAAALSAPPRNCDLPEVAKDPWRAWLDDKSNWDEFGSPKLEIHDWLLAPATEKEGGNDGN